MHSRLIFVPIAVVASAPALSTTYLSVEQAQALMFPGASFESRFIKLDQQQYNAVIKVSNVVPYSRDVKAWRASTGGWFILDQVRGKDDWISYALALDEAGKVRQIEILECLENYDGITNKAWLAQFYGRRQGAKFDDIHMISGATLSSQQMTAGVARLLATYVVVLRDSAT